MLGSSILPYNLLRSFMYRVELSRWQCHIHSQSSGTTKGSSSATAANSLVTENARKEALGILAAPGVVVGVAERGGEDLDADLAGLRRRHLHVLDHQRLVRLVRHRRCTQTEPQIRGGGRARRGRQVGLEAPRPPGTTRPPSLPRKQPAARAAGRRRGGRRCGMRHGRRPGMGRR